MLSLYIHIPFCQTKCNYCSFTSFSGQQNSIPEYLEALEKEIDHYKQELGEQDIKTIYFGWWTPNIIWFEWLQRIVEKIQQTWNCEHLAELSLEFNPYPQDQIFDLVKKLNKAYKKIPRLRFSFGIQSLDDEILQRAWRPYTFPGMTDFLRWLRDLKQENNVFNFDFIAFGKFKLNGKLRDDTRMNFFTKFVQSGLAESFSLYTLELHENSKWFNDLARHSEFREGIHSNTEIASLRSQWHDNDELIMQEFTLLKDIITSAGYQRYEISNFCRRWSASIHNMVYWNMENYLWLGVAASSFIVCHSEQSEEYKKPLIPFDSLRETQWTLAVRWTNTNNLEKYLQGERKDDSSLITLNEKDISIESFFLKLRTAEGIADVSKYKEILIPSYELLLTNYQDAWLVLFDWTSLKLTDSGMDVSNSIITDLLLNL